MSTKGHVESATTSATELFFEGGTTNTTNTTVPLKQPQTRLHAEAEFED